MGLNVEQERAATCADNLLVLAPPGSGKTGTLVAKTKYIIDKDINSRVILVTFTDASAKEARHRISKMLGPLQMERVAVSTFHSHAIDQLRKAGKLGKILSPYESSDMLRRALGDCGSTMDPMEAETELQTAKSTPDFTGKEKDFIAAYEARKHQHRAIDLQDVIREAVVGMRCTSKEGYIPPLKATHVLCDEFQDVDWNQLHWLLCYHALGSTVTVVGDDDQSVYGWRNSLGYDAMNEFVTRVSPTVINLEVNYRSKSEILQSATRLIRNNTKRMDKVIVSQRGTGGDVFQVKAADKEGEAAMVVDAIMADALAGGYELNAIPNGRWGIIARNNRDLWLIAAILRKEEIPFVKSSKKDDAPREIMTFCGMLISIQTNDTLGLRHTLNSLGIQEKTLRAAHEKMGDEFFRVMDGEFPDIEEIPIEERNPLKTFLRLCSRWREMTALGQYGRVIGAVGEWFLDEIVRGDDSIDDFKNFVKMLSGDSVRSSSLREHDTEHGPRRSLRTKSRGNLQMRVMNFFRQEDKKGAGGVSLYTMHGSKGLEFDRVFIAQCNSGTIPSAKSKSVDEERRLFYVAMTRGRLELTMSSISTKGPSPFLAEVG
jgi:superfamily I DNA/RNA helicase